MRRLERHPREKIPELRRSQSRDSALTTWLQTEVENAFSARGELEGVWREARRQYEGVPRRAVRTTPIPNAPNIEVTIGANLTDSVYAAAIDALFQASPLLVVRAVDEEAHLGHAKAMQRWVNWMAQNEVRLRPAIDDAFLDNCQLGTAGYYIPWVLNIKKTDILRTITQRPEIIPIATEDLLIPGCSRGDIQDERWVGMRFFYTRTEVEDRAKANPGWDISAAQPIARVDWMRDHRELMGHVRVTANVREFFEFIDIYCTFDYNEDGEDEDLLVTWDRAANKIIAVGFNPYDRRPIEIMRYQPRAHLFYGMGIMEMVHPFQVEATELHNFKILNSMLANSRLILASTDSGISETTEIWPNKVLVTDNIDGVKPFPMADVFPGMAIFEQAAVNFAEGRVGLKGELSLMASGGKRTPATTALSLLQQSNRRFTPAFDGMRLASARAVVQALWRYSERLKARSDDRRAIIKHIAQAMGEQDATLIVEILERPDFEQDVAIEFTAASAVVSREADRQNALLLTNAMDTQHQQVLQLMQALLSPQLPEAGRAVLIKMISAKNEMFDRLLRTFDLTRSPKAFIADIQPEFEEMDSQATQLEESLAGFLTGNGLTPPGIEEPPPGGPPGI